MWPFLAPRGLIVSGRLWSSGIKPWNQNPSQIHESGALKSPYPLPWHALAFFCLFSFLTTDFDDTLTCRFPFLHTAPILYHNLISSSAEDLRKNCEEAENVILKPFKELRAEYGTGVADINWWRSAIICELRRNLPIHGFVQLNLAIGYRQITAICLLTQWRSLALPLSPLAESTLGTSTLGSGLRLSWLELSTRNSMVWFWVLLLRLQELAIPSGHSSWHPQVPGS